MYVRGTGLIMGLALLTSGYLFSGQNSFNYLSGSASGQYSASDGIKAKFTQDPIKYEAEIRAKLNDIANAINDPATNIRNRQNKFVNAERAWVDSVMASLIPAAPAGAPALPVRKPIVAAAPGTKLKAQVEQLNQLVEDFDAAAEARDLDGMFDRYSEMLVIIPTLDLIDAATREKVLTDTQAAIKTIAEMNKRAAQWAQMQQLVNDFKAAEDRNDFTAMQRIYKDMRDLFPKLDFLTESTKSKYLLNAREAIAKYLKFSVAQKEIYLNKILDFLGSIPGKTHNGDYTRTATLLRLIDGYRKKDKDSTKKLENILATFHIITTTTAEPDALTEVYNYLGGLVTLADRTQGTYYATYGKNWFDKLKRDNPTYSSLTSAATPPPITAPDDSATPQKKLDYILMSFNEAYKAKNMAVMRAFHKKANELFAAHPAGLDENVMYKLDENLSNMERLERFKENTAALDDAQYLVDQLAEYLQGQNDRTRSYAFIRIIQGNNKGDKKSAAQLRILLDRIIQYNGSEKEAYDQLGTSDFSGWSDSGYGKAKWPLRVTITPADIKLTQYNF